MAETQMIVLGGLRTLMALLGLAVVWTSWRAYQKTKGRQFLLLAVGFGLLTAGVVLAGAIVNLTALELETALIAEAIVANVGLAVILYTVYGKP